MGIFFSCINAPPRCDERCPLYAGREYDCALTRKWYNWGLTTRPSDCPIVSVPEPHGDLVDREVIIRRLEALCDRVCVYSPAQRDVMCGACPLGDAFTIVELEVPTVVPASEEVM